MTRRILIIGAGMGGLTAALWLARHGFAVRVLEARPTSGGLAAGFHQDGLNYDAGPYVLLDRPGLDWAFRTVGLELDQLVTLRRLDPVYEVVSANGVVRFHADVGQTAAGLDAVWPGSGPRYTRLVSSLEHIYRHLQPLQVRSHPGFLDLLRTGAWRQAPFLLKSLASVLGSAGLPQPVVDALAIWTHVAGQRVAAAPSPLALVCAVIHAEGAFYPVGGVGVIPRVLAETVSAAGVEVRHDCRVRALRCEQGRVVGVETDQGEFLAADAVVSDSGISTYLELTKAITPRARQRLAALPLQSPGVCAYLAIRGDRRPPYLRFALPGGDQLCRLLVRPAVVDPDVEHEGWQPARLIAPMAHADAEQAGQEGQHAYLERVLAELWWRDGITDHRVVATRIPAEWGRQYHLYRDSMNPVMTARFMRQGRLAHRSPHVAGLYLAGSATHPGQWVSFCAVSGILAADRVREDLA